MNFNFPAFGSTYSRTTMNDFATRVDQALRGIVSVQTVLQRAATVVDMNSSTLFRKVNGLGGIAIGADGIAGADALGVQKFSLATATGILTAHDVVLDGTITASAGAIGGLVIGADYVRDAANTAFGLASTVTAGDDVRIYAGSSFANRGTAPARIHESGAVVFTNGTFTGTISATAGAIGGFDVGADYVRDAANSFGLASTVTAGDDVRFWAGATFANRATAPFRLTEAGVLTATSGTFSGALVTAGQIKGTGSNAGGVNNAAFVALPTAADTMGFTASPTNGSAFLGVAGGNWYAVIGLSSGSGASGGVSGIATAAGETGVSALGIGGALALKVTGPSTFSAAPAPTTNGTIDSGDSSHYWQTSYQTQALAGGIAFYDNAAYNQTGTNWGAISEHATHDLAAGTYKLGAVPVLGTAPFMYFNVAGKVCGFLDTLGAYRVA